MVIIRSPGVDREGLGPWEALMALAQAVNTMEKPQENLRAALIFLASGIKNLTQKEMADAMHFAAVEVGKHVRPDRIES